MAKAIINVKFAADLKQFSTKMQNANRQIVKMGKSMKKVGKNLTIGLTAPIVALGGFALKTYAEVEGVRTAFERLNKPGLLKNLQEATKGTVSNLELMKAAVKAENFQIPLEQLGTLLEFARRRAKDTGESVDYLVNSIVTGIGRKSPLILDNLGISTSALKDELNGAAVASSSIGEVTKAVGSIARKALGGMGEDTNTLKEGYEQLKASLTNIGVEFGKIIADYLKPLVATLKNTLEGFKKLSPETKKTIVVMAAFTAVVGPLLVALGFLMTSVVPGLILAFGYLKLAFIALTKVIAANPFGLLAVAIAAVASYFIFFNKKVDETIKKQDTLAKINDTAARSIANERAKLVELLAIARHEGVSKSQRLKAIAEINKISPKYLGNITLETINTDAARSAIEKYNTALLETARVKAAQVKLQEIESKKIDLELKQAKKLVEDARKLKKLKEEAVTIEDHLKIRALERVGYGKEANGLLAWKLEALDKEEEKLLAIIAAHKIINKTPTTTTPEVTERPKAVALDIDITSKGFQWVALSNQIDSLKTKLTFFQEFSGEFTKAVGASFSAMGSQIANVFETGNVVVDAFVGSIIGSLTELASAFVQQLIMEKIFSAGKKAVDLGKASSNAIVIATSAAAAMGPLGIVALPGLMASQLALVGGAFAGIAAFADGGVVGGTSFSGDKLFARINSGEMVLNTRQQNNLAGMMAPGGQNINIELGGGLEIDGHKLRVVLDRSDKRFSRRK